MNSFLSQSLPYERGFDAVSDHDPTHPLFLLFQWTTGESSVRLFCGRVRTYVLTSVCPSVCPQSSVCTSFLLAGTGVAGSFIVATRPNLVDWPVNDIYFIMSVLWEPVFLNILSL